MPSHDIRSTVFLTGFMGSGKSTVGPILANTLGYLFVDLDAMIENEAGRTIMEIFRVDGEPAFRAREEQMLSRAIGPERVVALGGGTIINPENLRLIQRSGVLVYLSITREQLFERLKRKRTRPMLAGPSGEIMDDDALMDRVTQLIEGRDPMYRKADIVVESGTKDVGLTVDEIVRSLGPFLR
jgi:shikimate kinase